MMDSKAFASFSDVPKFKLLLRNVLDVASYKICPTDVHFGTCNNSSQYGMVGKIC